MAEGIGHVVSLHICTGYQQPMRTVDEAAFTGGAGIEGDRHASKERLNSKRQVLLMDAETLDSFKLEPGDVRENVTTRGIDLQALRKEDRVTLGDGTVLEITGPCTPCYRLDEVREGLREALEGRRGMLARVLSGGTVKTGDSVRVLAAAGMKG
ncbi:MAG: MOSC domain-containing protein [SAR202 cluster bacterium]|nr:MOSC domain-containing protein [SAR202 cluster bacterium]